MKVPGRLRDHRGGGDPLPRGPEGPRRGRRPRRSSSEKKAALKKYYDGLVKKYAKIDEKLLKKLDFEAKKPGFEALKKDTRVLATVQGQPPSPWGSCPRRSPSSSSTAWTTPPSRSGSTRPRAPRSTRSSRRAVVAARGGALGIPRPPSTSGAARRLARACVFGAFVRKVVLPDVKVDEAAVRKYYDAHKADYTLAAFYKLESIGFATQKDAEAAVAKLRSGTDFKWLNANADGKLAAGQGHRAPRRRASAPRRMTPAFAKAMEGAKTRGLPGLRRRRRPVLRRPRRPGDAARRAALRRGAGSHRAEALRRGGPEVGRGLDRQAPQGRTRCRSTSRGSAASRSQGARACATNAQSSMSGRSSRRQRSCAAGRSLLPAPAAAQRTFKQRDCLECHKKEAEKFDGMKSLHSAVKQRKCEECHLRHGAVPKLALKEQGNELCFKCHDKKSIGMDKKNVHAVLRSGACSTCHDPARLQRRAHAEGRRGRGLLQVPRPQGLPAQGGPRAAGRTAAAPATWPTPPTRRTCSSPTR